MAAKTSSNVCGSFDPGFFPFASSVSSSENEFNTIYKRAVETKRPVFNNMCLPLGGKFATRVELVLI
jgi:hypothetical protein